MRIADTLFENNGAVSSRTDDRNGRGFADPATIFVRGAQPVIVNNTFIGNRGQGGVIDINVNSMTSAVVLDWGRSTGELSAYTQFNDNYGPLVRLNRFTGNTINGMVVRGGTLTTQVIWDDTDIAHVLYDEIIVPNVHTYGGIRLQSSTDASLVVKLLSLPAGNFMSGSATTAGFTASGTPLEIEDRIGGSVQIVGTPGHAVVLTSLKDDLVGAGFTDDNEPQYDTNGNGLSTGSPGDWRSIQLQQYSNDRNVAVVDELEDPTGSGGGANGTPTKAQTLGTLATSLDAGDSNQRLGFEVHGTISAANPANQDVYSFGAQSGQQVWFERRPDRVFAGHGHRIGGRQRHRARMVRQLARREPRPPARRSMARGSRGPWTTPLGASRTTTR